MNEQRQALGERGAGTVPRPAPLDGRPFARTIECDESAPEAKRTTAVTRARGARRGPDEMEGESRRE